MSRTAGQARRLLEEKVEKVSQQLAQVPERRTLLEAPAPDMGSGVFLSLSLSLLHATPAFTSKTNHMRAA